MRSKEAKQRRNRHREKERLREQERAANSTGETDGFASFDHPKFVPCPDCSLEGALGIDGKPRRIGRIPLRPSRVSKWRPLATKRCEICKGTGEIPYEHADPYNLAASKESRESLQSLVLWRLRHAAADDRTPPPVTA